MMESWCFSDEDQHELPAGRQQLATADRSRRRDASAKPNRSGTLFLLVIARIPTKIGNCGSDVGRAAVEKPSSDEFESIIKACGVEEIAASILTHHQTPV
jgi:hypothetical protein